MSKRQRRGRPRKARAVTLAAPKGFNGDHGTGTQAAQYGTEVVAVKDSPNHMGRRQRVNVITRLEERNLLTMRQIQAARAISDAYARVQTLSSGGELREVVDSTPKPDATVEMQVRANSEWVHVMRPVHKADRHIVEQACCLNIPLTQIARGGKAVRLYQRFRKSLDAVADHMRY